MCKECSLARWVPVNSQENLEKLQVEGANLQYGLEFNPDGGLILKVALNK